MDFSKLKRQVILKGGKILDPIKNTIKKSDLLLENGKIKALGKINSNKSTYLMDCKGLIITHGFCDLHAHFREPGREDKETLESGSMAALAAEAALDNPRALMIAAPRC